MEYTLDLGFGFTHRYEVKETPDASDHLTITSEVVGPDGRAFASELTIMPKELVKEMAREF